MIYKNKSPQASWTFLTNHAHVLLCIAKNARIRMRDLAEMVGITERAVQRIVADLSEEGYIEIVRDGRCNAYTMHDELSLRHPVEAHKRVSDLLQLLGRTESRTRVSAGAHKTKKNVA